MPDAPTRTVGVVGGGQLARMLQQAAISLAIRVVVLDPDPDCPAALAGAGHVLGTWTSAFDLVAFSQSGVDVVTFDHELAAPDDLVALEAASPVPVRPSAATKLFAQDKLHQRTAFARDGISVPAFAEVGEVSEVVAFAQRHGWPVVLKARRGGYDGRGVWIVRDEAEAAEVLTVARGGAGLLAEAFVPIEQELAVMVARRPSGQVRSWPTFQTTQVDGICTEVVLGVSPTEEGPAQALAIHLAEVVDLVGVMAVELFVTVDGRLLVNEVACRPHNSGHVTMQGCVTDQFEQHLRAVLDLPLGDPAAKVPAAAMVNLLGSDRPWDDAGFAAALAVDDATLQLYAKTHRAGRKLGHVNAVGMNEGEALARARRVAGALGTVRR